MDRKGKILELLSLSGTIELAREEINTFRYPGGPNRPQMLDISSEEEEKIIGEFIEVYSEYLEGCEDIDLAIDFYRHAEKFRNSAIGEKFLKPPREFLQKLGNITSRKLLLKMQNYSRTIEAKWEREKLPDEELN